MTQRKGWRLVVLASWLALVGALQAPEIVRAQPAPASPPADPTPLSTTAPSARIDRPLGRPAGPAISGSELDLLTEELAREMRCPVCQGLSIAASRSISALNMKMEVRQLLSEGYSADQVLDYFEQSYGEFVRLTPKATGFNLLVWILPLAGLLLGGVLIAWHRKRQAGRALEASDGPIDDYYQRVVDATSVHGADP